MVGEIRDKNDNICRNCVVVWNIWSLHVCLLRFLPYYLRVRIVRRGLFAGECLSVGSDILLLLTCMNFVFRISNYKRVFG